MTYFYVTRDIGRGLEGQALNLLLINGKCLGRRMSESGSFADCQLGRLSYALNNGLASFVIKHYDQSCIRPGIGRRQNGKVASRNIDIILVFNRMESRSSPTLFHGEENWYKVRATERNLVCGEAKPRGIGIQLKFGNGFVSDRQAIKEWCSECDTFRP